MKKHLIAAAVASAVAVPALAQVTVSGTLDVGYGTTSIGDKSRGSTISGLFATPDFRFSGTEDLGGGLKASFRLTQEFNVSSGALTDSAESSTQTVSQTGVTGVNGATANAFGEDKLQETSVALSGGFGTVKLGMFNHTARDNAGVYRFAGEFARLSGNFRSLGSKASNSVEYTTPSMSGLQASIGTSNGGRATADNGANRQLTASVGYSVAGLSARASWLQGDKPGSTGKNREMLVGGSYDLGVAKIGYNYASETDESAAKLTGNAHVFNVAAPLGKGLTVHGSYHKYGGSTATDDAAIMGLAVTSDLSKRTMVYAGYQSVRNGVTGAMNTADRKSVV